MKYAKIYCAQQVRLSIEIITIETDIANGLHSFSIVGLGDKAVNESKDRVSSAIKNSGFISPKQKNQKVVISLAPAHIKKEGTLFDLGIALSYLSASGDVVFDPADRLFIGELSLEGELRQSSGILPTIIHAKNMGFKEFYIPHGVEVDTELAHGILIYQAHSLSEVVHHLKGEVGLSAYIPDIKSEEGKSAQTISEFDMSKIKGNESVKRALEISAVGKHSILLSGPPGVGKTMLAKTYTSILPQLDREERLQIAMIHSKNFVSDTDIPFRSPHHTSSYRKLLGGGQGLLVGEITLAHNGVLFLDEFPEFDRRFIESLRQPMEDKKVSFSHKKEIVVYPADCIIICAMNPCPCGYGDKRCSCNERERRMYKSKLSGPILDRIDIFIDVPSLSHEELIDEGSSDSSATIRDRVIEARKFSRENSEILIEAPAKKLLHTACERLKLSGRGYSKMISVAKSIASLSKSKLITKEHLLEALQYRNKF